MAFIARALGNYLKTAEEEHRKINQPPKAPEAPSQPTTRYKSNGPLGWALSSIKGRDAAIDGQKKAQESSLVKDHKNHSPSHLQIKKFLLDDQNFLAFNDLDNSPIASREEKKIEPSFFQRLFSISSASRKACSANIFFNPNLSHKKPFGAPQATLLPLAIYRTPSVWTDLPISHYLQQRQSLIETSEKDSTKSSNIGMLIPSFNITDHNAVFPLLSSPSSWIAPAPFERTRDLFPMLDRPMAQEQTSSTNSWFSKIIGLFNKKPSYPPTALTLLGIIPQGQAASAELQTSRLMLLDTIQTVLENPHVLVSISIEDEDLSSEASESALVGLLKDEVTSEQNFMQAAYRFISEMISNAPKHQMHKSALPLAGTLFARLPGKKVSISVVCMILDKEMMALPQPPSQRGSASLAQIMSSKDDTPSFASRQVNVEHAGDDTIRRSSAQTGDVVYENAHFLQRTYGAAKDATSYVITGAKGMACGALNFASSRVNGAIDYSLERSGEWIGNRALALQNGIRQGLTSSAPAIDGSPNRAEALGESIGRNIRTLAEGVIEGARTPASQLDVPIAPPPVEQASTNSSLLQIMSNPKEAGIKIGQATKQTAASFSGALIGALKGETQPLSISEEPQTTNATAQKFGKQIGEAARSFGQGLYNGATASTLPASTQDESASFTNQQLAPEISSSTEGFISQIMSNPKEAGIKIGQAARETATSFSGALIGALKGKPQSLSNQAEPQHPAEDKTIIATAQKFGEQIGEAARSFGQGLYNGAMPTTETEEEISSRAPSPTIDLNLLTKDPRQLGREVAAKAKSTATALIKGAVAGVKNTLSEAADTQQHQQTESSTLFSLRNNPAGLGETLGRGAAEYVSTFARGLVEGAQSSIAAESGSQEEATSGQGSFAERLFSYLLSSVKSKSISAVLSGLSYTLSQAEGKVSSPTTQEQIREMIEEIEKVKSGRASLEGLKGRLINIMNAVGADPDRHILEFHLNGLFPISIREPNRTGPTTADMLRDVIRETPAQAKAPTINYKTALPIQKKRFVENIATMSAIQVANTFICNGQLSDRQISEIVRPRNNNDDSFQPNSSTRFIDTINSLGLDSIRAIGAKICFYVTSGIVRVVMKRFVESAFSKFEETINDSEAQSTEAKGNSIIKSTNEFLCVLKGRMKEVRDTNFKTGDPETMLDVELSNPALNHGYTAKQIYNKAINKAVYEVLPPLGWTDSLSRKVSKLSNLTQWAILPITLPLKAIVFVVEAVANTIFRKVVQFVVKKSNVLEKVINQSMSHINRNNYTHSINKIIYEQLKQIWQSLDDESSENRPEAEAATRSKKEAVREMVMSLSDVLRLNKQIRHADADPSILEKIKDSITTLCVDQTAEVIGLLIDKSKNLLLKPEMLDEREYILLEAINNSLESDHKTEESEMIALENEIETLGRNVLNKAIKKVVHKKLTNLPLETQQKLTLSVNKLKDTMRAFIEKCEQEDLTNSRENLLRLINSCSKEILDLQERVKYDANIGSQSSLFDEIYTKPFAIHMQNLLAAAGSNGDQTQIETELDNLKTTLQNLRDVEHINSATLPAASEFVESTACFAAVQAGNELLSEAWSLVRKPFVWKHGVMHRSLLAFIESKG